MDKTVALAVAGSGKTRSIVDRLAEGRRTLILTHTINAASELRTRVVRKFGYVPPSIVISTYFSFLITFCYRPLLHPYVKDRGFSFKAPGEYLRRFAASDLRRYFDADRRLFHCRLAKLVHSRCLAELITRIERYYDQVLVDEVQDFSAHDFDFLMAISKADVSWYLVGDFFQHTFDTSRDGNVNGSLHDDYDRYRQRLRNEGFAVDTLAFNGSHRCSIDVCAFIREQVGIAIQPAQNVHSHVRLIDRADEAIELYSDPAILKLFYQEHYRFGCRSMNWGESKGVDGVEDVCVVLNKSTCEHFRRGTLPQVKPQTRNKLYVASSRPHRNLYLLSDELLRDRKIASPRGPG